MNSTSKFYEEYSTNYNDNKYINLGLSINSQELISQLYNSFDENSTHRENFEDLLYAILDDIQTYKNENERLEHAHKSEKEKNDKVMTNMIEEAERQLIMSSERIKEKGKYDYEKNIERINQKHNSEIHNLQDSLSKLQFLENERLKTKLNSDEKTADLKQKINELKSENNNLITSQRELITQASVLRSEIAMLKTTQNQEDNDRIKMNVFNTESTDLKQEINILCRTNRKLNDTNSMLLNEISDSKSRRKSSFSTPIKPLKYSKTRPNYVSSDRVTDDDSLFTDEEIDSGNWTINSELSRSSSTSSNTFSKEIDLYNKKKSPTLNSIVEIASEISSPNLKPKGLPQRMFKLCFVGDSAVGKTSFIMRYCMGEFYQSTSATLGVDFHIKVVEHKGENLALQLWDTCGQERFRSIAVSYFRKADGAVLMYDCTNEKSFLNVREWIQSINYMSDKAVPIILIGNKIDMRDEQKSKGLTVIDYDKGLKLAKEFGAFFMETSTKIGTNVSESLVDLCTIMAANQEKEIDDSKNIKLGGENNHLKKKRCC